MKRTASIRALRLTFGLKLTIAFLLITFVFGGLILYDNWQTNKIETEYEKLVTRSAPLVFEVKELNFELKNQGYLVRGYLLTGNATYLQEYQLSRDRMNKLFESLEKKLITPEGEQQITETRQVIAAYHEVTNQTILLNQEKGAQEALKFVTSAGNTSEKAERKVSEFVTFLTERMDLRLQESRTLSDAINTQVAVIAVVISVLALLAGIWFARRLSRPLQAVVASANAIAGGDLRSRTIDYNSQDEFGELIKAFETMSVNLRTLVAQVSDASQQVAASSEELTASAEQSALAANQVAVAITDVAHGTETQLQAVDHAIREVAQMSASIQQIAANGNTVTQTSDKTAQAATQGELAVNHAINQMSKIEQTVLDSAQVVVKLGERSQEIDQIVNVISGIADQTNLLALNAAIEAARAGGQGRGFAVVAEEVRKLAEQSQEAARQIAQLIQDIQSETDQAVVAMKQGTQEVQTGSQVVNSAGQAFGEIRQLIYHMSGQIQGISAAIQQMALGSQQIVGTVQKIEESSKNAAEQSQTVSAATEEQSASMQEIAASSQSLAKMAEVMQSTLGKFKI